MAKYLIANYDGSRAEILEREWAHIKRINDYWAGSSGADAFTIPQVFDDTPENREFLAEWQRLHAEADSIEKLAEAMLYKSKHVKL